MAIVTSHTVHIAILPQSELLNASHNREPLKLKTYIIGPTTHVLKQPSVASVLWHPLGENGNCLVTVTADAVVRLWEFSTENRWSADSPALAVDLKKLLVAASEQDDVAPNRSSKNKVFTSDAVGMDVASACFGGAGYEDEAPWSAMTLYVAMKEGDIYALCPFLPSRWQPTATILPSLATTIVEKQTMNEDEEEMAPFYKRQCEDQLRWVNELDGQEQISSNALEESDIAQTYKRPSGMKAIPRLQGPFQVLTEDSGEILELSDIHIVAGQMDSESADDDDDSEAMSDQEPEEDEGLPCSLICLSTVQGCVYICIDLEGVEAQWLPRKPQPTSPPPPVESPLVLLEALETMKPKDAKPSEWPTFSQDAESPYSLFITHSQGVYYLSFSPWLANLRKELLNDDTSGTKFRIDILRNNISTLRERILSFSTSIPSSSLQDQAIPPACATIQDSDLGYFLLTSHADQPYAAILDKPYLPPSPDLNPDLSDEYQVLPELNPPSYPAYQPPNAFYASSSLPKFIDTHVEPRHRRIMKEEQLRMSNATLDVMTEAHRVLSRETDALQTAAADLFRRCETLCEVLRNQVMNAGEVAERVDDIVGEDGNGGPGQRVEDRMQRMGERQEELVDRFERLRKRMKMVEGKELSVREKEWKEEVEGVKRRILGSEDVDDEDADHGEEDERDDSERDHKATDDSGAEHLKRFRDVRQLAKDLLEQTKELTSSDLRPTSRDSNQQGNNSSDAVPSSLRRKKVLEVKKMLAKE